MTSRLPIGVSTQWLWATYINTWRRGSSPRSQPGISAQTSTSAPQHPTQRPTHTSLDKKTPDTSSQSSPHPSSFHPHYPHPPIFIRYPVIAIFIKVFSLYIFHPPRRSEILAAFYLLFSPLSSHSSSTSLYPLVAPSFLFPSTLSTSTYLHPLSSYRHFYQGFSLYIFHHPRRSEILAAFYLLFSPLSSHSTSSSLFPLVAPSFLFPSTLSTSTYLHPLSSYRHFYQGFSLPIFHHPRRSEILAAFYLLFSPLSSHSTSSSLYPLVAPSFLFPSTLSTSTYLHPLSSYRHFYQGFSLPIFHCSRRSEILAAFYLLFPPLSYHSTSISLYPLVAPSFLFPSTLSTSTYLHPLSSYRHFYQGFFPLHLPSSSEVRNLGCILSPVFSTFLSILLHLLVSTCSPILPLSIHTIHILLPSSTSQHEQEIGEDVFKMSAGSHT
ncbi:uncharacterized protein LOC126991246 [Eriocheir sinensis]|uniref:uncharacterized protein LOC126991246 n=1 Tax=Eriocheir sinensis TaxID=95602 RepID=UPI0021C80868|nr:uncharacterized protein LOC126991246 [Eriocheir sinensis]